MVTKTVQCTYVNPIVIRYILYILSYVHTNYYSIVITVTSMIIVHHSLYLIICYTHCSVLLLHFIMACTYMLILVKKTKTSTCKLNITYTAKLKLLK